jgi:hypothetical protein
MEGVMMVWLLSQKKMVATGIAWVAWGGTS